VETFAVHLERIIQEKWVSQFVLFPHQQEFQQVAHGHVLILWRPKDYCRNPLERLQVGFGTRI